MEEKDRKVWRLIGALSTVGITLVAALVIGFYIGLKLDEYFGTSPWLTIVFLILGIIAGFKNLVTLSRRIEELDNDKDKKD
ncbi:MAG: hypothetical protein A2X56_11930 [Nitrospirae bacterium GWC2_57_13]|jgi:ATP synthase protein I|nr:MAG: hypothetical protein A2072_04305 [Nitrospirae bacterium GWC1_57_7]OGW29034.1 MAG: hypothetical protein A2X56_11930 [Nitrospirae bacterium GWC2_57_13]OGW41790.1 MAG: hypothetical protein A2X57_09035 [Nitrospirae bacterium GWD2_57_8]HAR46971.1 hypothetical protein [Nitrospiraceae bacterium]HAS53060.1 hypothetical protein [Nitrospiraceae bacterium]